MFSKAQNITVVKPLKSVVSSVFDRSVSALYSAKLLIDTYSSALLEVQCAWAFMLMGIWMCFFDTFVSGIVFTPLRQLTDNGIVWGIFLLTVGALQWLSVRMGHVTARATMSLVNGSIWCGLEALYLRYGFHFWGTPLCLTFVVSSAISYIRLAGKSNNYPPQ